MQKTVTEIYNEGGAIPALDSLESRLTEIVKRLDEHATYINTAMQGLEDAAKEILKNDLIRVTLPTVFKEKLQTYITLREQARAAQAPTPPAVQPAPVTEQKENATEQKKQI